MRKEIMEKWVAALRSGQYAQTTAVLKDEVGYCCLGVLVDIAVKEGVCKESFDDGGFGREYYFTDLDGNNYATESLPQQVIEWAGMKSSIGSRMAGPRMAGPDLAALNDRFGFTFDDIANVIEKEYLDL